METTDLCHMRGQEHAKRALEVAASGGHSLCICGIAGQGATMLARALGGILPLDSPPPAFISRSCSVAALRCAAAQGGPLIIDDLHRFAPRLREHCTPLLRDGAVQVVATAKPCRCGYLGDAERACTCTTEYVRRLAVRMAPLLEQFAMHVELPRVRYEQLTTRRPGEPSAAVQARVVAARARAVARGVACNALLSEPQLAAHCPLDAAGQSIMRAATRQLAFGPREYQGTLRVARTIADLAGSAQISAVHLAEAIQYRYRPLVAA